MTKHAQTDQFLSRTSMLHFFVREEDGKKHGQAASRYGRQSTLFQRIFLSIPAINGVLMRAEGG